MKTIAICNSELRHHELCSQSIDFQLCNQIIPVATLHIEDKFENIPEDSVLVKINAFSCNYRDKSLMLQFNEQCTKQAITGYSCYLPFGSEFAGEVIDKGHKVKSLDIGDRVMLDAAYPLKSDGTFGGLPTNCASQCIQLFKQSYLKRIPDSMSNEKAAAFALAAQTSYSMIRKLKIRKGQKVLVTAATSNTSLAAILALRNKDIELYVCSSTELHKKELMQLGVHHFILKEELIGGTFITSQNFKGFDAVIDPFSDIYSPLLTTYMRNGGKYITCGMYMQNHLFAKDETMPNNITQMISNCIIRNVAFIGNCLGESKDLDSAIKDYQEGTFDILIDSVWQSDPLSFLDRTFNQQDRFGKVIYKYED